MRRQAPCPRTSRDLSALQWWQRAIVYEVTPISFQNSNGAKRDWYVWADPAPNGGPPNNWLSRFGGSAWEWDKRTEQYYYHSFLLEQPDLNWRTKQVRLAMAEVLRFWLQRGVDGFRVDASAVLPEDNLMRDDPPNLQSDARTPPPQRLKRIFTVESDTFMGRKSRACICR